MLIVYTRIEGKFNFDFYKLVKTSEFINNAFTIETIVFYLAVWESPFGQVICSDVHDHCYGY